MILGPEETMPDYVKEPSEDFSPDPSAPRVPAPRMATLYIGKGKKDKLSKGDILGFLCKTCGIDGKDIGKIDVYERFAYAAISRHLMPTVMKKAQAAKIKGVRAKVEPADQS